MDMAYYWRDSATRPSPAAWRGPPSGG